MSQGPMNKRARTECPMFNENRAEAFLSQNRISLDALTACSTSGGSRKSKRRGKKMYGGRYITAKHVKYGLYLFLAVLAGFGIMGRTKDDVINGLYMLFSGECSFVANRIFGIFRAENPICKMYNSISFVALKAVYDMDKAALASLVGELLLLMASPIALDKTLTFIANGAVGQLAVSFPTLVASEETPVVTNERLQIQPIELTDVAEIQERNELVESAKNAVDQARLLNLDKRIASALQAPRDGMEPEGGARRKTRRGGKKMCGKKTRKGGKSMRRRKTRRH